MTHALRRSRLREAIEFHLECLAAEGEAIPDEGALVVEQIEVAAA